MCAHTAQLAATSPLAVVRPATLADAAALATVHVASWRETYVGLLPDPVMASLSVPERARRWQTILDQPDDPGRPAVFVAERTSEAVGFGSCGEQRTGALREQGFTAEISALYVLRSAQGRGVGSALMGAMAQALTARNHHAASLWVLDGNGPARRFYEGLGGEVISHREERREDMVMDEVAYGWRDLHRLLQPSRPSRNSSRLPNGSLT